MAVIVPGDEHSLPVSEAPARAVPAAVASPSTLRVRTVLMVLGLTLAVMFLLALGYLAWKAITWVFIAAFLAMALNPLVGVIERRMGLGRGKSATIVFLLAALAAAGVGFMLIPPLVRETVELADSLPQLIKEVDQGRGPLGFIERELHVVDRLQEAVDKGGAGAVLGITTPVVDVVKTIVSTVFGAVAILFLTFFMLLDGRRWLGGFLDFVPPTSRPRWERVFQGIYRTVGGYVTGNLLISVIAGVVAGVTLFAVGVPYAVPIAIVVAILDLIPLVGAAIATAVAGAVALTQGIVPALIVLAVFLAYQQIENHVLQPLIYGRSVQLSPLAILIAVLVGAELAGVLGALAAIPIGGSVAVIAGELIRWRREATIETPPGAVLGPEVPPDR